MERIRLPRRTRRLPVQVTLRSALLDAVAYPEQRSQLLACRLSTTIDAKLLDEANNADV